MNLLSWAITFLCLSLLCALFGFGGLAATSAVIAQTLFAVFLLLFAVIVFARLLGGAAREIDHAIKT